jgi:hypothetical protein
MAETGASGAIVKQHVGRNKRSALRRLGRLPTRRLLKQDSKRRNRAIAPYGLRHRHRDGRPSGDLGLARRRARPSPRSTRRQHFGQTGSIGDLYRHHGIDANAIIDAAEGLTAGAPVRHRKMAV